MVVEALQFLAMCNLLVSMEFKKKNNISINLLDCKNVYLRSACHANLIRLTQKYLVRECRARYICRTQLGIGFCLYFDSY